MNEPIHVTVPNLYSDIFGDSKVYLIPRYQRPYSWETKQLEDLWNDLTFAMEQKSSYPYLLGSIYLAKLQKEEIPIHANESVNSDAGFINSLSNAKEHYFVIDGQQRLTTIFLLLFSIENAEIKKDLFLGNYPKLSLGQNDYDYFKGLLTEREVEAKTKSNQRLKAGYVFFQERFKRYGSKEALNEFIKNRLQFVKVTVENNFELTNTLFVSQTDRGKRLTNLEKLKSTLMFYAQKLEATNKILIDFDYLFGKIFINIETLCSMKLYSKPENAESDVLRIIHVFLLRDEFYRKFHNDLLSDQEKDRKIEIWHEAGEDRIYEAISKVFRENLSHEKGNINRLIELFQEMLENVNEYYTFLANYSIHGYEQPMLDFYEEKVWYPLKQLYSILGLSVFSKALLVDLHRLSKEVGINPFGQEYRTSKSEELQKIKLFEDIDRIKGCYNKLNVMVNLEGSATAKDIEPIWANPTVKSFITAYYKQALFNIAKFQTYSNKNLSIFNLIEENELSIWKNNKRPIGRFLWDKSSIEKIVSHIKTFSFWYKKDFLIRDLSYGNYKYVLYEYERLTQQYSNEELTRLLDFDIDEEDGIDIQREHIFAQSPENFQELKDLWLKTTNENYDDWVWKIGNIALLEHQINIGDAGNKKIWNKAESYLRSQFKGTKELAETILKLRAAITSTNASDDIAFLAYKILIEIRELELLAFTFYRFA
ncbi:MAG: DUF262 domain-containing protein [Candidatus Riflebacteria bacterium]|nr:DUF262 domain-containing protein [Candidatus Riflebacteria bacterium]